VRASVLRRVGRACGRCDSVSVRTVVPRRRKLWLALAATAELVRSPRPGNTDPVLPECAYLLQVGAHTAPAVPPRHCAIAPPCRRAAAQERRRRAERAPAAAR
jgi:hypothetical protein